MVVLWRILFGISVSASVCLCWVGAVAVRKWAARRDIGLHGVVAVLCVRL